MRRFELTKVIVLVLAVFSFVGLPVEPPREEVNSNLREVVGAPVFRDALTSKMSDTYFSVGGVRLNCTVGLLDGLNGCTYFRESVIQNAPVKAFYFLMPTRIGLSYLVLHSLEQEGKAVVSAQVAHAYLMRSYDAMWLSYLELLGFIALLLVAAVLIDRANAKRVVSEKHG